MPKVDIGAVRLNLTQYKPLDETLPVYIGIDRASPGGDFTVRVPHTLCAGCGRWAAILPPASQMKCECGAVTPVEQHCSERVE